MSKDLKLVATHEAILPIGDISLNVAVLSDGTRVITQSAIFKAFGRTKRGRGKTDLRVLNRPAFIDAKNLQPFINEELEAVLRPLEYQDKNKKDSLAYNALILPRLCKVYLDARAYRDPETGRAALTIQQQPLARASEILLLGLSNIGIISLIDEVTGYQYTREKDELQKILKAYIAEELLPWQKRFPDEFYKEIFRLNKWDYTVNGIKQRPGVVGTWTKQLVYQQLPKGVLKELYAKTPKSASTGKLSKRLHQSLTLDIGNPHLEKQLISVITLMNVSSDWEDFLRLYNKKFGQQEIDFGSKTIDIPHKEVNGGITNETELNKNLKGLLSVPPPPRNPKK